MTTLHWKKTLRCVCEWVCVRRFEVITSLLVCAQFYIYTPTVIHIHTLVTFVRRHCYEFLSREWALSHISLMSLPPFHPLTEPYNIWHIPVASDFMTLWCHTTSAFTTTTMLLSLRRIHPDLQNEPLTFSPLPPLSLSLSPPSLLHSRSSLSFWFSRALESWVNWCEFHKFVQMQRQQSLCPRRGQKARAGALLRDLHTVRHTPH